jgi:serine/threonine protein kinase
MADADWKKYKRLRGKNLPASAELCGSRYQLETLFKHDFYAATGQYRRTEGTGPERVILKIYHTESWGGIPLRWMGHFLYRRETRYFRALEGVHGIPQLLDSFGETGFVREYVDGRNLKEHAEYSQQRVGPGFFPHLQDILAKVHQRGISHNDLAKPENVLVSEGGEPFLIDFQIATMPRGWPIVFRWFSGPILRYMQSVDDYHLCKLYRRYSPGTVPDEIRERGTRKGGLLSLHYYLIRAPYRAVRHFVRNRFMRAAPEPQSETTKQTTPRSAA